MYRRSKKIIILIAFVALFGVFGNNIHANNISEDSYIFQALDALDNGDYENALRIYNELYLETKKLEYLKEMIVLSNNLGKFDEALKYAKEYLLINPDDLHMNEMLAKILINLNKLDEALELYENLLKTDNKIEYRKIISSLYLFKKDFKKAREYLIDIYNEEPSEAILLLLVSSDIASNNFKQSLPLIKSFFPNGTSDSFSQVLSELGKVHNILDSVKNLYVDYYDKTPNVQNAKNLMRIYLFTNDIPKALALAKKYDFDTNLTIDLYLIQKDYTNARNEANKAFKETQDDYYLGVLAIIDFEDASDKQTVIPSVIERLKVAVNATKSHLFYNYLGYLLIDFDIDVDEGIKYVQLALSMEPNNAAYLDSLAWGYYKNNKCDMAKAQMDKIPLDEVESQEEIKEHLEKINQCLMQ